MSIILFGELDHNVRRETRVPFYEHYDMGTMNGLLTRCTDDKMAEIVTVKLLDLSNHIIRLQLPSLFNGSPSL